MKDTYTVKEAMDCLGLRSKSAFLRLEKEYPDGGVLTEGLDVREKLRLGI